MNDFVKSSIRTYVPIAVGALFAWLATLGLELNAEAETGLIVFGTALSQGAYYLAVHLLEQRWPAVGKLLGASGTPVYANSRELD